MLLWYISTIYVGWWGWGERRARPLPCLKVWREREILFVNTQQLNYTFSLFYLSNHEYFIYSSKKHFSMHAARPLNLML